MSCPSGSALDIMLFFIKIDFLKIFGKCFKYVVFVTHQVVFCYRHRSINFTFDSRGALEKIIIENNQQKINKIELIETIYLQYLKIKRKLCVFILMADVVTVFCIIFDKKCILEFSFVSRNISYDFLFP